jgi:glycosyltransferase involved in cell wall biosynthesis
VGDEGDNRLVVTHLQRGPLPGNYSAERIFEDIRAALAAEFEFRLIINPYPNRGLMPRLAAALNAWRSGTGIRHVLGDAHFLAWLLPRHRTVLTIFDCVSLTRLTGVRRWIFKWLWYNWPIRRAAYVTTVSRCSRDELLREVGCRPEQLHVIPPPLSPEFRFASPRPHDQWRRILHVGTNDNKNLLRSIEALDGLGLTLVTVGQIGQRAVSEIAARGIAHEAHVDVSREVLVQVYEQSDVLLFASTYEGFGMPIIEAQAVGRPVVTSDLGSMPEAAGADGACLVDPFDVASIRAGVLRVLGDRDYAARLIAAGLENSARYDLDVIAGRYAELYRRIASSVVAIQSNSAGAAGETARVMTRRS